MLYDPYGFPVSTKLLFASRETGTRPSWPVRLQDTKDAIDLRDWQTVLSASRRLYANYGVLKGAIHQKALHAVGRAWEPHFQGEDIEWGEEAARWLSDEWFGVCDVRGGNHDFKTGLYLDSIAVDRDGDFAILLTESEAGYPQIQHIPAHRIGVRNSTEKKVKGGKWSGYRIEQGIILNDKNRPVAYRILGEEEKDDRDEDAANVVFCYDPEYHDQIRGIPGFSHALNEIRDAMQSETWEQHAMLIASTIGLIEHNETGGADINDPGFSAGTTGTDNEQMSTQSLEGGMIRYFKAGSNSKLEQFTSNRPGDPWQSFQDRIIRKALYGINWPYSLAWKPEKMNGTQERSEIEKARTAIADRQDLLMSVAKRVCFYAMAKAAKPAYDKNGKKLRDGLISPMPADWYRWKFTLPAKFSIDAGRDGQSRREDYKLGIRNLRDILGEEGKDYDSQMATREGEIIDVIERSQMIAKSTGVPFETVINLFQQRSPNPIQAAAAPTPEEIQAAIDNALPE